MDIGMIGSKVTEGIKKYRYALLIVLIGLVFMLIPTKSSTTTIDETQTSAGTTQKTLSMSQELEQILSHMQGVGDVKVMLTVSAGEKTIFQTDPDISGDSQRHETVIVTDSQRAQSGLVQQVNPAVYQGAIIVCHGADSAAVRLAVVEAVARVTGLGADRISVLKMK